MSSINSSRSTFLLRLEPIEPSSTYVHISFVSIATVLGGICADTATQSLRTGCKHTSRMSKTVLLYRFQSKQERRSRRVDASVRKDTPSLIGSQEHFAGDRYTGLPRAVEGGWGRRLGPAAGHHQDTTITFTLRPEKSFAVLSQAKSRCPRQAAAYYSGTKSFTPRPPNFRFGKVSSKQRRLTRRGAHLLKEETRGGMRQRGGQCLLYNGMFQSQKGVEIYFINKSLTYVEQP